VSAILNEIGSEAIDRSKPRIRLEDWTLLGDRLYGVVYNHPGLRDGEEVGLNADGVTVPTHLSEPYKGDTEYEPLHEGTEVETHHSRYRLGQESQDLGEVATLLAVDHGLIIGL
jgi:hypothetical protein